MAGTSYRLTCTVALPSGVQFDDSLPPDIQWPEIDTSILTPTGPSRISSGAYVSSITLDPLRETHSGQYSCSAKYSLDNTSSQVVTDMITINVNRELS